MTDLIELISFLPDSSVCGFFISVSVYKFILHTHEFSKIMSELFSPVLPEDKKCPNALKYLE